MLVTTCNACMPFKRDSTSSQRPRLYRLEKKVSPYVPMESIWRHFDLRAVVLYVTFRRGHDRKQLHFYCNEAMPVPMPVHNNRLPRYIFISSPPCPPSASQTAISFATSIAHIVHFGRSNMRRTSILMDRKTAMKVNSIKFITVWSERQCARYDRAANKSTCFEYDFHMTVDGVGTHIVWHTFRMRIH